MKPTYRNSSKSYSLNDEIESAHEQLERNTQSIINTLLTIIDIKAQ